MTNDILADYGSVALRVFLAAGLLVTALSLREVWRGWLLACRRMDAAMWGRGSCGRSTRRPPCRTRAWRGVTLERRNG